MQHASIRAIKPSLKIPGKYSVQWVSASGEKKTTALQYVNGRYNVVRGVRLPREIFADVLVKIHKKEFGACGEEGNEKPLCSDARILRDAQKQEYHLRKIGILK